MLDLRNNGGGHVITSNMLSTCIGGSACQDRVYQYYRYNDERMADWKQTSETFGMSYDQTEKLFSRSSTTRTTTASRWQTMP